MKYFGTDGIRGTYGDAFINEEFFGRLGEAASRYVLAFGPNNKIVIGADPRFSSTPLKDAFCKGARGVEISDMGSVSTPLLAFGTKKSGAALGVMITASHNPYTDNGIKFFNTEANKVSDETQLLLERFVDFPSELSMVPSAKIVAESAFKQEYMRYMLTLLPARCLSGMKIALDSANGATVGITSEVLKQYGATLVQIGNAPDGKNINFEVGSENSGALAKLCKESGAHIGFAHDGDGDRLVVCDENGEILNGEEVLALIAEACKKAGTLEGGAIVTTVQSNMGLDKSLEREGIKTYRSGVGDRLVMQLMIEKGCNMGGENSGHYIFSDISPCGDGLAAAIKLLSILISSHKKLSELKKTVRLYPVCQAAIKVARKVPVEETPSLFAAMVKCEETLGGAGRILVRYSGTENKIRLLVEGEDKSLIDKCFDLLKIAVENDLK